MQHYDNPLRKVADRWAAHLQKQIKKAEYEADSDYQHILQNLQTIAINATTDTKFWHDAFQYLYSLPWRDKKRYVLHKPTLVKDGLAQGHVEKTKLQSGSDELTDYAFKQICKLYEDLKKDCPTKSWDFEYPLVNGEVKTKQIAEWQESLVPKREAGSAYKDIRRDIAIDDELVGDKVSDYVIADKITNLCSQLNTSALYKLTVAEWMKGNAAQDLNRFVDYSFMEQHFGNPQDTGIATAIGRTLNWVANTKTNYIEFQYVVDIKALVMAGSVYGVDPNASQNVNILPDSIIGNKDKLMKNPTLMNVVATVSLDLIPQKEGAPKVVPKVTNYLVTCYASSMQDGTVLLQSPSKNPEVMAQLQPGQAEQAEKEEKKGGIFGKKPSQ